MSPNPQDRVYHHAHNEIGKKKISIQYVIRSDARKLEVLFNAAIL